MYLPGPTLSRSFSTQGIGYDTATCKNRHRNAHPHFSFDQYNKRIQGTWRWFNWSKFQHLVILPSHCVSHSKRNSVRLLSIWWSISHIHVMLQDISDPISLVEFVKWLLQLKPDLPGVVTCFTPGSRRCCDSSPSVSTTTCSAGSMWCKAVSAGMPSESLVAPCGGYWRCSLSGLLAPPVSAMTPPLSSSLRVPSPGTTCIIRSGLYTLILLVHLFLSPNSNC